LVSSTSTVVEEAEADAFSVCEGGGTYEYELFYWATSLTKMCASGWDNGALGVCTGTGS
jgi:hypothetical protein